MTSGVVKDIILFRMKYLVPFVICILTAVSCSGRRTGPALPADDAAPVRVHRSFDFTTEDLSLRLDGLPSAAAADPVGFLSLAESMLALHPQILRVVDKSHQLPPDTAPVDPVALEGYPSVAAARGGLILERPAAEALQDMSEAAAGDGVTIIISSAYRPYDYQAGLFRSYTLSHGAEAAGRFSAREGTSQHQLGSAVDLGDISNAFARTAAGEWMNAHAGDFGWSLSYPPGMEEETGYVWESWHWRWIGHEAVLMQRRYFEDSQYRLLIFWEKNSGALRSAYLGDQGSERMSRRWTSSPLIVRTMPVPTGTT